MSRQVRNHPSIHALPTAEHIRVRRRQRRLCIYTHIHACLSHTHTHTHTHTLSLSLSLTHTHTHTHATRLRVYACIHTGYSQPAVRSVILCQHRVPVELLDADWADVIPALFGRGWPVPRGHACALGCVGPARGWGPAQGKSFEHCAWTIIGRHVPPRAEVREEVERVECAESAHGPE